LSIVTGLRTGWPRNTGSIPGKGKTPFSHPKPSDPLWSQLILLIDTGCDFFRGKAATKIRVDYFCQDAFHLNYVTLEKFGKIYHKIRTSFLRIIPYKPKFKNGKKMQNFKITSDKFNDYIIYSALIRYLQK
jgi:hypothetical protein